ncbi:MAG TPA: hypothetical protein VF447_17605 [Terriglobales bacterium]
MPSKPRVTSDPVEMPVRASETSAPDPAEHSAAPQPMLPPLGWPRVAGDEVNRRAQSIDTAVSFPYRKSPMPAAKAPATDPPPGIAANSGPRALPKEPVRFSLPQVPKLELVHSKDAAKFWLKVSRSFSVVIVKARIVFARGGAAASTWFGNATTTAGNRIHSVDFKKPVANVREFSAKRAEQLSSSSQQWRHAVADGFVKLKRVAVELAVHARRSTGTVLVHTSNAARSLHSAASRAWTHQVRIRIRSNAMAKVAAASNSLASAGNWRVNTARLRDRRLQTSMLMAGASAVLALAVIVGLRHYGPVNASSTAVGTSAVHASATPSVQEPTPVSASEPTGAAAKSTSRVIPTAEATTAAPPAPKKTQRVHHVSSNDDYVAPDTYKYYGSTGKQR